MVTDEDFDFILGMLLENCYKQYRKTAGAEYLKQKREKMDED